MDATETRWVIRLGANGAEVAEVAGCMSPEGFVVDGETIRSFNVFDTRERAYEVLIARAQEVLHLLTVAQKRAGAQ